MAKIVNGWTIPQTGDKFSTNWGAVREALDTKFAELINSATGKFTLSADSNYSDFITILTSAGTSAIVFDTINKTIAIDSLSADKVLISNNKSIISSNISVNELGYLSGISSNIQSQINDKLDKSSSGLFATSGHTHTNASSATTGFLTSGDWNTFNSKLDQSSSGLFATSSHTHDQGNIVSGSGWITDALNGKESLSNKGTSGGYASLDSTGRVPASQLPSYVDDVQEFATSASFPNPGSSGIIYLAIDSNKIYRWGGSVYVEITSAPSSLVTTVAGRFGDVILSASDITDIYKYYTSAQVENRLLNYSLSGHTHDDRYIALTSSGLFATSGHTHTNASSTTTGFLTSGDWNTFNSKLNQSSSGLFATSGHTHDDRYIALASSGLFATSGHTHTWSQISATPTTLSGYGITDVVTTTENITSTVDVGAITIGQTISSGTSINDFVKSLLLKTYYPTFVAPTASLTSNLASSVEAGTLSNVTLTMTLNRGSILGKLVGGVWSAGTQQDYRSGVATQYIIAGTNTGTTNNTTISSYTVVDSSNTWSASVYYGVGPQPTDSLGANYSTPLTSGTLNSNVTVYGRRKAFYGTTSATNVPYTLSSEIRALSSSLLNPVNGSTFTISIPVGAKQVVFAYPNTLQVVSSVKYVEGLNAEVKSIFNLTNVNVEGLNGYSAISYKIYTYVPATPFTSAANYNVTI